ncbi:MAG: YicC/YloC family endoribonuclease [Planctomycetota bacterium]
MIQSMTGFGDAQGEVGDLSVAVEVKSLNNRFFKAVIRLPDALSSAEPELESLLRRRLGRGSVYFAVKIVDDEDTAKSAAAVEIDEDLARHVMSQLSALGLDVDATAVLSVPGVVRPTDAPQPVSVGVTSPETRAQLAALADAAVDRLIVVRKSEGDALEKDLVGHLDKMQGHLDAIATRAGGVVEQYHDKVQARVNELLAKANLQIDRSELLKEVAVFAERSDISEELHRLGHHVAQFRQSLSDDGQEHVGRKLDFIAQEMLREANTIGSKANDADIAGRVVEMKGLVDRLKEQVQNVE